MGIFAKGYTKGLGCEISSVCSTFSPACRSEIRLRLGKTQNKFWFFSRLNISCTNFNDCVVLGTLHLGIKNK